ncbi:MAG TPA: hypothetical protein VF427_00975 [Noviherbaspirillum sp.]
MPTTPGGMGWLRDYPDLKGYIINTDKISIQLKTLDQRPVKSDPGTLGVLKAGGPACYNLPICVNGARRYMTRKIWGSALPMPASV